MSDEEAKPESAAEPKAEGGESQDAVFEALWSRCLEAWDDDKPHTALLDHALKAQKLPELAGRYRTIKETDPDKAARAEKKINGIVVAATQMLMAQKTPARTKTPLSWTLSLAIVVLLVSIWMYFQLFPRH